MTGHIFAVMEVGPITASIGEVFTTFAQTRAITPRQHQGPVPEADFAPGAVALPAADFTAWRDVVREVAAHPFIAFREWDTDRPHLRGKREADQVFADTPFACELSGSVVRLRGALWGFGQLEVEHARVADLAALLDRITVPAAAERRPR